MPRACTVALAVLFAIACGKDAMAPGYGTIALTQAGVCATPSAEYVVVWVDDVDRTNELAGGPGPNGPYTRVLVPASPNRLSVPNVVAGARRVVIFRQRYGTEGELNVTVKAGAQTLIRLDCPDGYTITNP